MQCERPRTLTATTRYPIPLRPKHPGKDLRSSQVAIDRSSAYICPLDGPGRDRECLINADMWRAPPVTGSLFHHTG